MRRLVVVLAVIVLSTGCGSDDSQEAGGRPPVSLAGPTNDHGTATASGSPLHMELDDFYFGPTFVKATAGQSFTIELENEGDAPHTFTSNALGIDEQLDPGQRRTITVTAPQSGTAVFICRLHQAQGMQGAIVVG